MGGGGSVHVLRWQTFQISLAACILCFSTRHQPPVSLSTTHFTRLLKFGKYISGRLTWEAKKIKIADGLKSLTFTAFCGSLSSKVGELFEPALAIKRRLIVVYPPKSAQITQFAGKCLSISVVAWKVSLNPRYSKRMRETPKRMRLTQEVCMTMSSW